MRLSSWFHPNSTFGASNGSDLHRWRAASDPSLASGNGDESAAYTDGSHSKRTGFQAAAAKG